MTKQLVSAKKLLALINLTIAQDWKHKEPKCSVLSLKQVNRPGRNWEVDTFHDGGATEDIPKYDECTLIRDRALDTVAAKFNVDWDIK